MALWSLGPDSPPLRAVVAFFCRLNVNHVLCKGPHKPYSSGMPASHLPAARLAPGPTPPMWRVQESKAGKGGGGEVVVEVEGQVGGGVWS
jgi:hypothetical protein